MKLDSSMYNKEKGKKLEGKKKKKSLENGHKN
jgi:hypothetical protein